MTAKAELRTSYFMTCNTSSGNKGLIHTPPISDDDLSVHLRFQPMHACNLNTDYLPHSMPDVNAFILPSLAQSFQLISFLTYSVFSSTFSQYTLPYGYLQMLLGNS